MVCFEINCEHQELMSNVYILKDDGEKILIDVDGKSADEVLNLVELVGGATER